MTTIPTRSRALFFFATLLSVLTLSIRSASADEPESTRAPSPPLPADSSPSSEDPSLAQGPSALPPAADIPSSTTPPKQAIVLQRPLSWLAPPRNVISIQLFSLLNHGVTIQYERQLHTRVSLATSLGYRWSGGDAYDVTEIGAGMEGRVWLMGRAPFMRWESPAMVGPYIGLRTDLGQTRVTANDEDDRLVGTSLRISETLMFGARIVIAKRFELAPSYGIGFRTEVDPRGRLASWTRFEPVRLGMTAGVMF